MMPKYVFYTDKIGMDVLSNVDNAQMKVGTYAVHNWQEQNFDQCSYVMKNAMNLSFATQQSPHDLSVRVKITGELSEQDYILYRLKY
jgi:hypothetical protein